MAQLNHGVNVAEMATATSIVATSEASLPFVVGCAPVHNLPEADRPVNVPKLITSYREYLDTFGELAEGDNLADYTLTQAAQVYFERYNVAPMIMVNVFNPETHTKTVQNEDEEESTLPDVTAVTDSDIIGLQATRAQKRTGLQLIDECFPRFRMVPSLVVCPGRSSAAVGLAIIAAASNINGMFKAVGVIDIPDTVEHYSDAAAWLADNNLCSPYLIAMYGDCLNEGVAEPGSLHVMGCLGARDAENDGVPFWSPSNYTLSCEGLYHNGQELFFTPAEANILNGAGICTGLSMTGGLKLWGNLTTAWPSVTDVKDAQIPVRRIFNWVGNSIILTAWQWLDNPVRRRTVETVQSTLNVWLNSLAAREYILGGRVEFVPGENSEADLMAGRMTFTVYLGASPAAGEFSFKLRYDPAYLSEIFAEE